MPILRTDDFPNGHIVRTRSFDGRSLWGYVDGGADLYLEYGFDRLTVQEIEIDSIKYTIDVYRMQSDTAAFGIFSLSHNWCVGDSFTRFQCITRHQIQFARGPFYVSIVNATGSMKEQHQDELLARILLSQMPADSFQFPEVFRDSIVAPLSRNIKYINGRLGLENGSIPVEEKWFDGLDKFSIYSFQVRDTLNDFSISLISVFDSTQAATIFHRLGLNPNLLSEWKMDNIEDMVQGGFCRIYIPKSSRQVYFIEYHRLDNNWRNFIYRIEHAP